MNPTNLLAPTYRHMLTALSAWLKKAEAQMPDKAEGLLLAQLAPDMFPLSTQIRFACAQAQEGMYRLQDEEFPRSIEVLLDEGRNAREHPGTMADARSRIEETLALVRTLSDRPAPADPDRFIAHELPNGMVFDLTVDQYARDWAIGQFYFHVMTAYAILRNNGVQLGKADYVGHMFPYLRPGTAPGGHG
ncbi:DUF1993 domain-containing protein [Altererythrobacter sp. SALINAS58]|uniref:DUF1993 domain-containing protein n=1 Tax=Alteripontixanthobacter muriae TaxID=2705546 RepID=UPI001577086C|nr:DUF1993 domain-containing protein [Alteripontixanthobacter muriae]NTZ43127.1 DUF1993 domain-containing protein [Alteripontixanthobacter muriae]